MKKTAWLSLVFLLACLPSAWAQEEGSKSLKHRIRSVSSRKFVKSGRIELSLFPLSSISLNDAFYQKFGGGLGLAYHLSEAFALQAMATYSLNQETEYASYHGSGPTEFPYAGKRKILIGADFCWSPVYGKVSVAAEWVMHFDTYLMVGFGAINGELKNTSSFGFAGAFGLGARFFFSRALALKLELKDYMVFNDKVSYGNIEKSDFQHQLLFNLGLSIFFLEGSEED